MPTKKKLSTRPIKISVPSLENSSNTDSTLSDSVTESSSIERTKQDSVKQETALPETNLIDSTQLDSITNNSQETIKPKSRKLDSVKQETVLPEIDLTDSTQLDSNTNNSQETIKPVTRKLDSITEYKKVAMRLSQDSAERLREFRGETGIPYEILVDVMVRNWDNLPKRTQNAYLKESQQIRAQRLIAGQQKAMLTTQKKYSQL